MKKKKKILVLIVIFILMLISLIIGIHSNHPQADPATVSLKSDSVR